MRCQWVRENIMDEEYEMTETEFQELDQGDVLAEGVNWLPAIQKTLLDNGFSYLQTSPSRIHVYHHDTNANHPLAEARAVASHRGYKLFHRGKALTGSRQATLEKHLRQLCGQKESKRGVKGNREQIKRGVKGNREQIKRGVKGNREQIRS